MSLLDDSANTVLLTVTIEQIGTRTIEFPVESIRIDNLAENLKVSFGNTGVVAVRFTGTEEALDKLDIRNAVSIDLDNYTKGFYEVEVEIEELVSDVSLLDNPKIQVILTEKQDE